MANSSVMHSHNELPPLPEYHLTPLPSLLPPIPDKLLTLLMPIAAYWALSMFFHWIDTMDYFPQYRLHTPAEVAKRNKVSRWEVVRDVVIQQIVQTAVGWVLGMTEPDDFFGKEQYDVAVWARRIRIAERAIPRTVALLGLDAAGLAKNLMPTYPVLAGAITGGQYNSTQGFASWELYVARAIYWVLVPVLQFAIGIIVVDTWQYFLHRAMHMNKWLYTKIHSRHHRLYVPYAYGALYNHPVEGFLLDTVGTSIAFKLAGMNTRQGMVFFTGATFKTVDDHCGYALPWDPLQHITSNNAGYHDVHHQSWGIKTNFSQPFFTFWDRLLGTVWTGGDVSVRYERSRIAAQNAYDKDIVSTITGSDPRDSANQDPKPYQNDLRNATDLPSIPMNNRQPQPPAGKAELQAAGSRQQILDDKKDGGPTVLADEAYEEKEARKTSLQTPRKRATSAMSAKDSFKGLRDRVTGSMHGRTGGIIGVDGSR
ncbi:sphinganine C4-monooxygenase, partial [Lecanoromycetidae sp. Uapishka_2]